MRLLLGALALLSLSGCQPYVYVEPNWEPVPYPPDRPYPYPGFPPVGYESDRAVAIAMSDPRIVGAIEYASRAYPHYSLNHKVEYGGVPHMYDVWIRIYGGPVVEVYRVGVSAYANRVTSIQTYHDYGPHRWEVR